MFLLGAGITLFRPLAWHRICPSRPPLPPTTTQPLAHVPSDTDTGRPVGEWIAVEQKLLEAWLPLHPPCRSQLIPRLQRLPQAGFKKCPSAVCQRYLMSPSQSAGSWAAPDPSGDSLGWGLSSSQGFSRLHSLFSSPLSVSFDVPLSGWTF